MSGGQGPIVPGSLATLALVEWPDEAIRVALVLTRSAAIQRHLYTLPPSQKRPWLAKAVEDVLVADQELSRHLEASWDSPVIETPLPVSFWQILNLAGRPAKETAL